MLYKIDFKNYFFRKILKNVSKCEIYKKAFSHYYLGKNRRNSNLQNACGDFQKVYDSTSKNGTLVNDLCIVYQKGINITVKKKDQTLYKTINLATNSYNDLDLEQIPRINLVHYVANEVLSSCLSRKIAGQLPIHNELENEICDFLKTEDCLLATSGYIAQQTTMFGLFRKSDVIFSDEYNHSSLVDGMRLSQAKIIVYPHLNYSKLEKLIIKHRHKYNSAGIVSDGVFSAHGTVADLDQIHLLKTKYNLISVIDDTHGFATIGKNKRGVLDLFQSRPDVITASLAKGLAGFGGLIAGNKAIIRVIDCMGRQNINTSHLSPLVAAQSLYNLQFLRTNLESIAHELLDKIIHFNRELDCNGIKQYEDPESFSHPIFSFYADTEEDGINAYQQLLELGFTGAFFPPPVSPKPTIRFSIHRKVDHESLTRLAEILKRLNLKPLSKNYWPLINVNHRPTDDKKANNLEVTFISDFKNDIEDNFTNSPEVRFL